jgi:hypothetical protein
MNEEPIRCVLYGSQYASIQSGDLDGICCSGLAPMQRLGQKLMAIGIDANRKIRIERGGIHIGSATVGEAANGECNHNE